MQGAVGGIQRAEVDMTLTDAELVVAYGRRGETAALEELVRRHYPRAYALALRSLRDPAAADDAAQDALVGVIRASRRFEAGRAFAPWWHTILFNAIRKAARGRERRGLREARYAARRPRSVEPAGERALERQEVAAHLAALPEDLRLPLILHFYDGQTHRQVARALDCPVGTASSRIRRGLERLRSSLSGAGSVALAASVPALLAPATAEAAPRPPSASALEQSALRATTRSLLVRAALALSLLAAVALGAGLASRAPVVRWDEPAPFAEDTASERPALRVVNASSGSASLAQVAGPEEGGSAAPLTKGVDLPTVEATEAAPPTPTTGDGPVDLAPRALVVRVWDPDGNPAAGARVEIQNVVNLGVGEATDWEPPAPVVTGSSGEVRFAFAATSRAWDLVAHVTRGLARADEGVSVAPNGTRDPAVMDVRLEVPLLRVRLTADGEPLADQSVWAVWGSRRETLYGKTDEDGRVGFDRVVHAGTGTLLLRVEGFAPQELTATTGGELLEIPLGRGATVRGRVVLPPGADAERLSVRARGRYRTVDAELSPAGDYVLRGLEDGEHELLAAARGHGVEVARLQVEGGAATGPTVSFQAGARAVLRGRVVAHSGEPLPGLLVDLSRGAVGVGGTRTDANGCFSFPGLPPGNYRLRAFFFPGDQGTGKALTRVDVGREDVDAGDLRLPVSGSTGTVRGVVRGPDGTPVAGAVVYALALRETRIRHWCGDTTDASGRFEIEGVPTGPTLLVSSLGPLVADPARVEVTRSDEPTTGDLRLRPGATLVGRVLASPEFLAARPSRVFVRPSAPAAPGLVCEQLGFAGAVLEGDGTFRVVGLPPGHYRVSLRMPRRADEGPDGIPVTLVRHEEAQVTLDSSRAEERLEVFCDQAVDGWAYATWPTRGDRPAGRREARLTAGRATVRFVEPGDVTVRLQLGRGDERRELEQRAQVAPGAGGSVRFTVGD